MSSKVNIEEVRHMAKLSRLAISPEDEREFAEQLGNILGHMDLLSQVETSQVEPLYTPSSQPEHTRGDVMENIRSREQILANAPDTDGEYFIVPRIV